MVADPNLVDQIISQYRDLVDRNQVKGDQRNIDWWGKQGWEKFENFVQNQSNQTSPTQRKRKKSSGKSITLIDNEDIFAVVPLDRDASCFHGRDTKWCTAVTDRFFFNDYFHSDELILVYFFLKDTGEKYAAATSVDYPEDTEFFNENDKVINEEEFQSAVGFNISDIIELITEHPNAMNQITDEKHRVQELENSLENRIALRAKNNDTERDPTIEKDLIDTANYTYAYYYAKDLFDKIGKIDYPNDFKRLMISAQLSHGIVFINNVTERDVKFAIKNNDDVLARIYTDTRYKHIQPLITPTLLKELVTANPIVIRHIKDDTPELQLIAVKKDPAIIRFITNPSREMQEYVLKYEPRYVTQLNRIDPDLRTP